MNARKPIQSHIVIDTLLVPSTDQASPASSAIVGITALASLENVLAVLRTAILVAKNLRAPLSVDIPGKEVDCSNFSSPQLSSEMFNSVQSRLLEITSVDPPVFVLEASIIAESFVAGVRFQSAFVAPIPIVKASDREAILPKIYERNTMLDLFYIGVVIVFFVLLWGFTTASERL